MKKSLWKDGNFVRFFTANMLSNFGNWFDFVAVLILFRYTWKADPIVIALIPVMYAIPSILLGQFAGVFVDRRDKVKVLIYSDWIRAILTIALILTTSPLFALPVLLLRNTVGVVSLPAQQGLMRRIVDEEDIMKAVTINGSLFQLVKVVGPLLGGAVAGLLSANASIALNAFSFVLSGVILMKITVKKEEHLIEEEFRSMKGAGFFESWKEGWYIVFQSRILTASILFGVVSTLVIQMIDAQFVTLFSEVFPNDEEITGFVIAAIGGGSLLVVLLLNKMDGIKRYGWYFGVGSFLIGLMTFGMGFLGEYQVLVLAISLALVGGIGNGIIFTAVHYLIQKEPPKEAIGRVSGIVDSTLSILFIAGPLLGGVLIEQVGVLAAFKVIGISLSVIGLTGILFQRGLWKQKEKETFQQKTKQSVNA
ncbi:MFS transporter [Alkalihalobacillus sp. CinArs1]|uniref:MFS transporter n=1 Tax=Alkalihalobacillus sp. CinArs1 TaxID=2995314 RepID=UPI0022DE7339|nr:MFS transporter [Alkalihalobacillus sp. CinArs1]